MTNEAPTPQKNTGFSKVLIKALVPVVVIVALATVGLQLIRYKLNSETSSAPPMGQVQDLDVGTVLPDFGLNTLDGKSTQISKVGAKVILLNFWATWCEACMVEMPSIVKLHQMYKDKGLAIVAVDLDEKPEAVVPRTAQKLGMSFPIYVDTDGKLSDLFDVHAIPLTLIMDQNRKVLFIEGGERDWAGKDIQAKMNQWLGG